MSLVDLTTVAAQMQTKWSSLFVKELRAMSPLPELVNKDYKGEITNGSSQVVVSMVKKVQGQTRTAGVDANTFETSDLEIDEVTVVSNKRFVASTRISELAELQSQLADPGMQSQIREALLRGAIEQWENYLWSLVSPSTSSPDHLDTGNAAMSASELNGYAVLAAQAKWARDKGWYGLLSPAYIGDLRTEQTLVSKDYVDGESVVVSGQIVNKRFGFGLLEDNSRTGRKGLFFHPDFLISVIQKQAQFKISDLHSQQKFGYLISVDLFGGAKLNVEGSKQHIYVTSGSGLDMNAAT